MRQQNVLALFRVAGSQVPDQLPALRPKVALFCISDLVPRQVWALRIARFWRQA